MSERTRGRGEAKGEVGRGGNERGSRRSGPDGGRRKLLIGGAAGIGVLATAAAVGYRAGWFGGDGRDGDGTERSGLLTPETLTPTRENAVRAASEIVSHYTRRLRNASSTIHAVRAFGRNFRLDDKTGAVDYLCSRFAAEREVGGKRHLCFPREHEVHDNSFLKTMLEAGVALEQPITVGSSRYTLRDLGESARALFRFDPGNLRRYDPVLPEEHLPWGLIAFSILVPPTAPTWVNALGEKIDFNEVIDRGLADYEGVCRLLLAADAPPKGESTAYREKITKYSCYGMHSFYGFFSCYRHGYRGNGLSERLTELKDHLITRLQRDAEALARETDAARQYGQKYIDQMGVGPDGRKRGSGGPPADLIDVISLNNFIKMNGHGFEALNYIRLHNLFPFSMVQEKRMQAAEAQLFEAMVRLRARDLDSFYRWDPKFVSDIVIAVSHALRAMKLLSPDNPDNAV